MDVWCCCLLFCVSRPPARGLLLWIPGAGEAGLRRAVCAKIPFAMITIYSPLERVNRSTTRVESREAPPQHIQSSYRSPRSLAAISQPHCESDRVRRVVHPHYEAVG